MLFSRFSCVHGRRGGHHFGQGGHAFSHAQGASQAQVAHAIGHSLLAQIGQRAFLLHFLLEGFADLQQLVQAQAAP